MRQGLGSSRAFRVGSVSLRGVARVWSRSMKKHLAEVVEQHAAAKQDQQAKCPSSKRELVCVEEHTADVKEDSTKLIYEKDLQERL
mmetsp:Transcript_1247/g.2258  ORF Transcript_1247/g.2258 Transcript_1247/m.2258 type:complete len:86 (-) Transcript_1247:275-532(-)